MKLDDDRVTNRELGIMLLGGLVLVVGSIWWIKGAALAALVAGLIMIYGAHVMARE